MLHRLATADDNQAVRRLAIVCLKNGSAHRDTIALLEGLADDDRQEKRPAPRRAAKVAADAEEEGALGLGLWRRVRVRLEVGLAPPPVGDVGVELGRRQVGVAEHLLDAAEVGAAFEQVRRERVAEQVGVDAAGLEAGLLGEPAQDQEGAGAGQRAALRVQEELGPVAAVEVGAAAREVAAERLDRRAADRDDPLLVPLADARGRAARRGRRRPARARPPR